VIANQHMNISSILRASNDSYQILDNSRALQADEDDSNEQKNSTNSLPFQSSGSQLTDQSSHRLSISYYLQRLWFLKERIFLITAFLIVIFFIVLFFAIKISCQENISTVQLNNSNCSKEKLQWDSYYKFSSLGAVAADVGNCSAIGTEILRLGGNAVDAAVSTALCVGVLNPMSSGIGGGCFILIHNASSRQNTFIDSRETAPGKSTPDVFVRNPLASYRGGLSIATPAELRGLVASRLEEIRRGCSQLVSAGITRCKVGSSGSRFH